MQLRQPRVRGAIGFGYRDCAYGKGSHRSGQGGWLWQKRRKADVEFTAKSVFNLALQGDQRHKRSSTKWAGRWEFCCRTW